MTQNIINKMQITLNNNMPREYYDYSLDVNMKFLFDEYDKTRNNFNGIVDLDGIGKNNELILKYLIYKRVNEGLKQSGAITIIYDLYKFIKKFNVQLLDIINDLDKLILYLRDYHMEYSYIAIRVAFVELGHFINTDLGFDTYLNRNTKKLFYYILKISYKYSLTMTQIQYMISNIDTISVLMDSYSSQNIDRVILKYMKGKQKFTIKDYDLIIKYFFNMEE